ncbi:HNH endonuclease [Vibrio coralliilyticus]|uniref:HNH endonuclease n=1 Tax=Vibrio coralliilyticus TaxID=190893 RepID=UPI00148D3FF6|nr:HNH endonuclease [Vibrio coralliilyticus]NOI16879.1 HNH endonuclease [Vibrio coralliilyticus]
MSHEYYVDKFRNLNMNIARGKKSPHKVCMLLAVMDLIQAGNITSNKIELNQALKDRFADHFNNLAEGNDKNTPENPFFFLRSEGFWHLSYNLGYEEKGTSRYSSKAIEYAYLDDELFVYMKSFIVTNEFKEALVSNLTDLASHYYLWLMDIGKSEKTANNYLGAVRGSISNWLIDEGEIREPLTEVTSYRQFVQYEEKVKQLEVFKLRDLKGKGMYSAALSHYHKFLADLAQIDVNADIRQVMSDQKLTDTEKSIMVKTRMGQGHFRSQLVQMWGGCAVTGYRNTQLLLASHIKPWRQSNNKERLDKFNGLLLLANLDKAFDLGFISFDNNGKVLISDYLETPEVIGLREDMSFRIMREHKPYLAHHRDTLFKGSRALYTAP